MDSHHARTAVVLTFDTEQTRNRVLRTARERRADNTIPKEKNFYFTEMPRQSRPRPQTHTEDELQEMREEAIESQEKKPKSATKGRAKKNSKVKSETVPAASKVKKKYSHLTATANRRRENDGLVGTGTKPKTKRSKLYDQENDGNEGPVNAVSTPVAGISSDTPVESLSTLVQEISSIIPRSNIDTLHTPEPVDSNMQIEIENDLYEIPQSEGDGPDGTHLSDGEAERRCLEESIKEETILIERIERMRSRLNSDGDLR